MLISYVRNRKGEKIGCLLAAKTSSNCVGVGWSKCNKLDKFDKKIAKIIAEGRANKCPIDCSLWMNNRIIRNSPTCIYKNIFDFVNRAKRYFKDAEWYQLNK